MTIAAFAIDQLQIVRYRAHGAIDFLRRSRSDIFAWQKKAFWTLSDQAMFSGSNFLISVLLARWLSPTAYGAYSIAYSAFLMVATLHSAILVEPMLIFGSGKYASRFSSYFKTLLRGHVFLIVPANILLLLAGFSFGRLYSAAVRNAIWGLVVGSAGILLFWLVRRVFYVMLMPHRSAVASGVYFLSVIATVAVLRRTGLLSAFSAFLAMAIASVCASAAVLAVSPDVWQLNGPELRDSEVATDHWVYGRWAVCTAAIQWFPANMYFYLLPTWQDLVATGALRALLNVAMPVLQAISALSVLLLPSLVRERRIGPSHVTRMMLRYLLLFLVGAGLYVCLLWPFRQRVFDLASGSNYSTYSGAPLILACLLPFGSAFTSVLANGLRALEHPDRLFWCYLTSAIGALTVGLPLTSRYGVTGALLGIHVSSIFTIVTMVWLYRYTIRNEFSREAAALEGGVYR